jgi:hypothetical protein
MSATRYFFCVNQLVEKTWEYNMSGTMIQHVIYNDRTYYVSEALSVMSVCP